MLAAVVLALQLSAALPGGPAVDPHACINEDSSPTWSPVNDHTLVVSSGRRRFKVTTATCPVLRYNAPQVDLDLPSGGLICGPHDAHLYVRTPGGAGPSPCPMLDVQPISAADADALMRSR